MLGITKEFKPRFLRRYADLHAVIGDAVTNYISDIKSRQFPNEAEQY
jgi:3-methyl-2-oxobutanoate hydroxymethyltransferase